MTDNLEQIKYWNGPTGDTWVAMQERMDEMLKPLSAQALAKANTSEGERVIDIGCGCGATSIAMAQAGASVWGVDISAPMLDRAKSRAVNVPNVQFSESDAATQNYTPDHDLVFSRFGVMFFTDPVAAFTNIHTSLATDGRLMFMCWQKPSVNPWVSVGGKVVQPYLPVPDLVPDHKAPGPFAFADPAYVEDILVKAGFSDVRVEAAGAELNLGSTAEEATQGQMQIGPLSNAVKQLEEAARIKAIQSMKNAFADYLTPEGVKLGASVWLVSARR